MLCALLFRETEADRVWRAVSLQMEQQPLASLVCQGSEIATGIEASDLQINKLSALNLSSYEEKEKERTFTLTLSLSLSHSPSLPHSVHHACVQAHQPRRNQRASMVPGEGLTSGGGAL